jgi:Cys-tRNA(Pro)/Cys-tRNA(Cys) deacylase
VAKKDKRTNAMRMLDAKNIAYVAHRYAPDTHSADGVAEALGFPASQVFKTLVVVPASGRGHPLLAIVPAGRELDLKALAKTAGEKKLRMASQREAESLTGLLVGGISALALLQKGWRVCLDASAHDHARILVSAGQRGINLELAVADLVIVTRAKVRPISRAPAVEG